MADPALSLDLVITAVDPMTPLVLVNGPIAGEIGMNGDAGASGRRSAERWLRDDE